MPARPSDGARDAQQAESLPCGTDDLAIKRRREQIRTSQRRFRNRQRTQIEALQNQVVHLERVIQDAVDELVSLRKDHARESMVARATRLAQILGITVQDSSALLKVSLRQAQSALFSHAYQKARDASPAQDQNFVSPIHAALIERFVDYLAPTTAFPDIEHYWINDSRPRRSWRTGALLTAFSPLLHTAYTAIATAFVGQFHGDWRLVRAGEMMYSTTLRQLQAAIGSPEHSGSDAVLMATTLCVLYEGRLRRNTHHALGAHVFGALTLFAQRGPENCVSGVAHELYVEGRVSWVWFSIMRRCPTFLSQQAWKVIPWSGKASTKDILAHLFDDIVEIPQLLAWVDGLKFTSMPPARQLALEDRIRTSTRSILQGLGQWRVSWLGCDPAPWQQPGEQCPLPVFRYEDKTTGEIVRPAMFMFSDAIQFQARCHYYAALLLVLSVDKNMCADRRDGLDDPFQIACLFCRCMHYFMLCTPTSLVDRVIMAFKVVYDVLPPGGIERDYLDQVYVRKIRLGFATTWDSLRQDISGLRVGEKDNT